MLPLPAEMDSWASGPLDLAAYAVLVLATVAILLFLCSRLGQRKPGDEKSRAYECGIVPAGAARLENAVPFHLVAVFFLVYDVGTMFILCWAAAARGTGWNGLASAGTFTGVLLAGWLYIRMKGGFAWGPSRAAPRSSATVR